MIPANPHELHDFVMSASDDCFFALREEYPALDAAIGECNFTEIRDGITPNTYSVVLLLNSLAQCVEVREYANLIIEAHQKIVSSVLESFQILYQMPDYRGNGHTEQIVFIHNF